MDRLGFSRQIKIIPILGRDSSDDELAIRVRSLLRWKIRYRRPPPDQPPPGNPARVLRAWPGFLCLGVYESVA